MRSRTRIIGTLLLLTVAALLGGTLNRDQTLAAPTHSCKAGTACPNNSSCEGDTWYSNGNCAITCYKESGAPGQVVYSGSAHCGTQPNGGGNGGFEESPVLP